MLCAAPTVLIGLANAPIEARRATSPGVRVMTAGAPPAAATIEAVEDGLGWTVTQAYGLTETVSVHHDLRAAPEHSRDRRRRARRSRRGRASSCVTSGELKVVDADGNEVPTDGETQGEIVVRGNVVMAGYLRRSRGHGAAMEGGLVPHRATQPSCIPTATRRFATG